jgi:LDH2 family malate/lactate/ureidoglycolate dehydrogenase
MAMLLTNSDLRGVRSHGTRQICRRTPHDGYCQVLRDCKVNPNPQLTVIRETSNTVLIEGDGSLGYAPMMMATEVAIDKAREQGMAMGATVNTGHYGSAGHYVYRAMEEGMIAFSVQGNPTNRGRQQVPPEQRLPSAYWGNPPFCFGFPSQDEPPLVLDMATCILGDDQRGEEYDALQELIPGAFFKSMGLTGVAQALGGTFVGADGEHAEAMRQKWPRASYGGLVMVFDTGLFAPVSEVRGGIDNLMSSVRDNMAPVAGYDTAGLPGSVEYQKRIDYTRDGIPVGEEDLVLLNNQAEECGVEPLV